MVKVIAVANQKGGCGKTTTSINVSACLAFLGKRVLLIDLDPQAHSSIGFGVNPEELERSLFDIFDDHAEEEVSIDDILVRVHRNLDLAPSQIVLSAVEQKLSGAEGRERKLAEKIKSLRNAYDFIVIDCPPSLGLLTFNALSAADEVLIPVEPSFFALHGLSKLLETIDLVRDVSQRAITVHSVITLFDPRTKHSREVTKSIQRFFSDNNLSTVIRRNIKLQEAVKAGKPITEYDRNAIGFKDYMNLAVELIEQCGKEGICIPTEEKEKQDAYTLAKQIIAYEENETTAQTVALVPAQQEATAVATLTRTETKTETEMPVAGEPRITPEGILFSYQANGVTSVEIAGDFNNWQPHPLNTPALNSDVWLTIIPITEGVHKYKYVVDGNWCLDPHNMSRVYNEYGSEDCLINIYQM